MFISASVNVLAEADDEEEDEDASEDEMNFLRRSGSSDN